MHREKGEGCTWGCLKLIMEPNVSARIDRWLPALVIFRYVGTVQLCQILVICAIQRRVKIFELVHCVLAEVGAVQKLHYLVLKVVPWPDLVLSGQPLCPAPGHVGTKPPPFSTFPHAISSPHCHTADVFSGAALSRPFSHAALLWQDLSLGHNESKRYELCCKFIIKKIL